MTREFCLPEHWNKWELEEILGSGAYGTVFQARYVDDPGRIAAIKVIPIPKDSSEASALYREYRSMEEVSGYYSQIVSDLVDEIQTLMSLKGCKNIVQIEDYHVEKSRKNEYGWTIYIRMELLVSLQEYLQANESNEELALRVGLDMCDALIECEKAGIIHRDIKQDNILVAEDGTFKLGDFGVAKRMTGNVLNFSVKGTFAYMSPEVYQGRSYDHTADVYSLGIVLYKLLNLNRDPFVDVTKQIVSYREKEAAMGMRMSGASVPAPAYASKEMSQVIQKACAFSARDRYQSAAEMKEALENVQGTEKQEGLENAQALERQEGLENAQALGKNQLDANEKPGKVSDRCSGRNKLESVEINISSAEIAKEGLVSDISKESIGSRDSDKFKSLEKTKEVKKEKRLSITKDSDGFKDSTEDKGSDKKKKIKSIGLVPAAILVILAIIAGVFIQRNLLSHTTDTSRTSQAKTDLILDHEPCSPDGKVVCTLDKSGVLTVEGAGEISGTDEYSAYPWDFCRYEDIEGKSVDVRKVVVGEGITFIGHGAFKDFPYLSEVDLPDGLEAIGQLAFDGCEQLSRVENIPESLREIGQNAFQGTRWIEDQRDKNGFIIINSVLVDYNGGESELTIPKHVRTIGPAAFYGKKSLIKVILPEDLQVIRYNAFYNCTNLREVVNLQGNTSIEEIEESAFADTSWEKFQISKGNGFAIVDKRLFAYGGEEKKVSVPDEVEEIIGEAFSRMDTFTEVTIPENVHKIGNLTFSGCANLEKVTFEGSGPEKIPEETFSECVSLKEISIPDSVKVIGNRAFCDCVNLEKIRLPKGIEHIEQDAFEGCYKIKEVEGASELDGKMIKEVFAGTEWYETVYSNKK